MTETDTYHRSNLGAFAGNLRADMDGYVHLTAAAVLAGAWDTAGEEMTAEQAEEIAAHNRKATEAAEASIAEWQSKS